MVPCEFRCSGQYLSWQFTIGLCATLARSQMSDLTPSLAFFGLRNTAWAGHIRFKNSTGEWWLVVSPWGRLRLCQQGETEGCL